MAYRHGSGLLAATTCVAAFCCLVCSCSRAQDQDPAPTPPVEDECSASRNAMVDRLIGLDYLWTSPVIRAMRTVPRHKFVPAEVLPEAYDDRPLPIGHDQTISAPSIVALMTELIEPRRDKTVLEIGTGSGYQAAVLSPLVKHVYTIEIVAPLGERAAETLKALGFANVTVRVGDGYKGWPQNAPFDGIMVTCAPQEVPAPLVEQLKEGGRMVIPVGESWDQQLYVMTKRGGRLERKAVLPVLFVPMTGEAQARPTEEQ